MSVFELSNPVQHYAWGSPTRIPEFLGVDRAGFEGRPVAELWMGAHPKAPSCRTTDGRSLLDLIRDDPEGVLGAEVVGSYGRRLPFLAKFLAARTGLSIQAHPDLAQARDGFRREEESDIDRLAPERTYRDPGHKPELIYAVDDFYGLCGFRAVGDILREFEDAALSTTVGELMNFSRDPGPEGLFRFFRDIYSLDPVRRRALAAEVLTWARSRVEAGEAGADSRYEWILRLSKDFPDDIGLVGPLFLNLVHLTPGQALFLPPRTLHAYLQGFGLEVMANSDNVLRAGLTVKHVDAEELIRILDFTAQTPRTSDGPPANLPVAEFACEALRLEGQPRTVEARSLGAAASPVLVVCMAGHIDVEAGGDRLRLNRGASAFVTASEQRVRLTGPDHGRGYLVRVGHTEEDSDGPWPDDLRWDDV